MVCMNVVHPLNAGGASVKAESLFDKGIIPEVSACRDYLGVVVYLEVSINLFWNSSQTSGPRSAKT
jgi:hypothetical protein